TPREDLSDGAGDVQTAAPVVPNDDQNDGGGALLDRADEDDDRRDPDRASNLGHERAPRSLEQFLQADAPEDPWELHERIGALAEIRRRIDARLSRRLFEFWTIGGTLQAGFRSLRQYAREVLGMGERRARYLFEVERKLLAFRHVC